MVLRVKGVVRDCGIQAEGHLMFPSVSQSWSVQVNTLVAKVLKYIFSWVNLAKDVPAVQHELEAFSLMKIEND